MKGTIKKLLAFSFCAAIMAGCYKDKGNYEYQDINAIQITPDVEGPISILLQDTLRINVTIHQTIPSTEGLEFDWVLYQAISAPLTRWSLGNSQNLKAQITQAPGTYTLDYFVKDKSTGVSFRKTFSVIILGKFNEGWLVVEENGGTCDLTMITPIDSVFRNIYSSANGGEKLPAGTHRINVVRDRAGLQKIYIMSPEEMTQTYYVDFLKVSTFSDQFWGAPAVKKPQEYFIQGTFNEVLLNDGYPHGMTTNAPAPYKLGIAAPGEWDVEPYDMYGSANGSVFYDKVKQAFFKYNLTDLLPFAAPPPTAVFNVNNVGKKMLHAGANTGPFYDCLFKNNNDDSLFVYRVNPGLAQPAVDTAYIPNTQAPGLLTATKFVNSRLLPHLYYVSDNILYLLDIPARQARPVYTFPAGAVITSMKMYTNIRTSTDPENNRQVAVATMEGSEGKVYTFSIDATGDFVGNTHRRIYTGFGRINDIALKWAP